MKTDCDFCGNSNLNVPIGLLIISESIPSTVVTVSLVPFYFSIMIMEEFNT